jgi:hypothetical protein
MKTFREYYKGWEAEGSDLMAYCRGIITEIKLLSVLGEYEEATDLLINLNQTQPNYGRYAELSNPAMDKIKSEHPPFVEALNNLKLPPKLDLEGLVKL